MSGLAVSQNRSISNIILKGGRDQHANGIFRQAKVIRKKYYKGNVNFQQQIIVADSLQNILSHFTQKVHHKVPTTHHNEWKRREICQRTRWTRKRKIWWS